MSGVARGALWIVIALAAFFAADALIFRAGWYNRYLEPISSAGTLEDHLHWLTASRTASAPEVLVIGDSRIAEGFSARTADSAAKHRLHFWNFGIPGTTPRVWYYALRDADPTRRRFTAIVIALEKYSDADSATSAENRVTDQSFLVMRLRLRDCYGFAWSLESPALRYRALFECLFPGILLRTDVRAFLAGPKDRISRADESWRNGLAYLDIYGGKRESLSGLTVDWAKGTAHFPEGVSAAIRDNVNSFVLPAPAPNTGALSRYRQRWLGGILSLYKDSPTRIVFLQLPRGPLVRPGTETGYGFVDTVLNKPRVQVLPADTFTDLERPELYADGLHLNKAGRPIFSARLAEKVDSH